MYIQVVYLEVQQSRTKAFLEEVTANVEASRLEPGVIQFDLLQRADQPDKYMLYEVYRSAEAAEAHRQTDHFKRWVEKGVPLLTGERIREIYRKLV